MDPLGVTATIVDALSLPRWSSIPVPAYENPAMPESDTSRTQTPFPVRQDLNAKVALWSGDITKLNTIAIVNTTNESLSNKGVFSERIHRAAGPDLLQECKTQLLGCRTGEAKMSKGYSLPARYVIHTECYEDCKRDQNRISWSVCNKHVKTRVPPEDGAHIALRTVRRFLEKFSDIERVVFVVENADEAIYKKVMPLYFPRNKQEEDFVLNELPGDIGNENGEPIIAERQIRIMDKPLGHRDDDDDVVEEAEEAAGATNMLDSSVIGKHSFTAMAGDHDQLTRQRLQRSPNEMHVVQHERVYQRWLRRARTEDLSNLVRLKMVYQSGVDFLGRPVVVFVGRHFQARNVDLNKAVAYFIHVLDKIVNRDYVIVYLHTLSSEENQPPLSFLKDIYHLVDIKYRRNLKAFYIVHPTVWARIVTWFFTTFTASSIKEKVHFLSGIQYLYDWIDPDQLEIPAFVLEYDMKENGNNYHTPASTYRTGSL
ncbi:Ganglioside-induced differentiation-associated protein 2 [Desmophyllum pertusum]|uniref:Ganglioside-induced differentiation-associated protein 2 n=1 Tax=Desmophyllum pertusum TaxID=174260 RepID=A0A9W9Y823_9CNID|nr:Ganglioside-induced differentiation-associated protein 2 [Desmophyllum pertusum]